MYKAIIDLCIVMKMEVVNVVDGLRSRDALHYGCNKVSLYYGLLRGFIKRRNACSSPSS
jgi:hypothetical protein